MESSWVELGGVKVKMPVGSLEIDLEDCVNVLQCGKKSGR